MANTWPELHSGTNFNYVWDTVGLEWVKETQAGGGAGGGGDASAANQTTEIARLTSILAQLDVALSTRAVESGGNLASIAAVRGTEFGVSPAFALQVGGSTATGGEFHAATVSNTDPANNLPAFNTRNISGMASNGGGLTGLMHTLGAYDSANSVMRPVELTGAAPAGTERGIVVRNIPSGTQGISAASLPLPTGAAIEAGHLATIDTSTAKIPSQGQALAAGSMPVVLTAIQQAALTPPAAITGFALEATQITGNTSLSSIDGKLATLGQKTMAGSVPVTLASDQAPIPTEVKMLEALQAVLVELRVQNLVLHSTLNSRDDLDFLRSDLANTVS